MILLEINESIGLSQLGSEARCRIAGQFLVSNNVSHVLAEVSEIGGPYLFGYVQNSFRKVVNFDTRYFEPVTGVLLLRTYSDDGTVESVRRVQLLRVAQTAQATLHNDLYLAQFVSKPILEVARPDIERQDVRIEWATAATHIMHTEALPSEVLYPKPPKVMLVATLVSPPGAASPIRVSVTTSVETVIVDLGSIPVEVRVRSTMYEPIVLSTDSPC